MKEIDRLCWKLVSQATDALCAYELFEPETNEGEKHYDEDYAVGMGLAYADIIEFMTVVCDIPVMERAQNYVNNEEDIFLEPNWLDEHNDDNIKIEPRVSDGKFKVFPDNYSPH